jgi:hypothetical protein
MNPALHLIELVYATAHHELSSGRVKRASEAFRLLTMLAPEDERGWLGLGEAHLQAGHEAVAVFVLESGVRLADSSGRCQLLLSLLARRRDDAEQVVR